MKSAVRALMCFCKFFSRFFCRRWGGVLGEMYASVISASRIIPGMCACVCQTPLVCRIVLLTLLHAPSLHLTLFHVSQPSHLHHFKLYPQTCPPHGPLATASLGQSSASSIYSGQSPVSTWRITGSLKLPLSFSVVHYLVSQDALHPSEEAALLQQPKPESEGSKSGQSGKIILHWVHGCTLSTNSFIISWLTLSIDEQLSFSQ